MLLSLNENYELGILTNGKIVEQKQKIERMKLYDIISPDQVFISDEIGYEKPDPKSFHYALNKLNATSTDSIYVGDSWVNDIEGSINAGMSAVWVNDATVLPEDISSSAKIITIPSILDLEIALQSNF